MKKLPIFIVVLAFIFFSSCASIGHYDEIDSAVGIGEYDRALSLVQESKETNYTEREKIIYYLDEGMLAHYAKDYKLSSKMLMEAERSIEEAVTKSISLEISTYLVNDLTQAYPGEDYEDIYLNIFNALNFWHQGLEESAFVEIRRFNNKIKFLSTKYGQVITNSQKALLDKGHDVPFDEDATKVNFSNSALGQYLGLLFYRSVGDYDDARINRDQLKLTFANHPHLYQFPLPKTIDEELNPPVGKARLNIISFVGPSPLKEAEEFRISLGGSNWIKISVPKIIIRPSEVKSIAIEFDSGQSFSLDLIEDMASVAVETFKQKAAFTYLKTAIRSTTKTATSMALKDASSDADSLEGLLLMSILSIGTQIYAEASEQADTRISRYFPAKAYVGGFSVDPGVYSFSVIYKRADGLEVYRERFEDIDLKANKLNLVEAICIK